MTLASFGYLKLFLRILATWIASYSLRAANDDLKLGIVHALEFCFHSTAQLSSIHKALCCFPLTRFHFHPADDLNPVSPFFYVQETEKPNMAGVGPTSLSKKSLVWRCMSIEHYFLPRLINTLVPLWDRYISNLRYLRTSGAIWSVCLCCCTYWLCWIWVRTEYGTMFSISWF